MNIVCSEDIAEEKLLGVISVAEIRDNDENYLF